MSPSVPKAHHNDFLGRFREIVSDPNNVLIPRVPEAGLIGTDPRFNDHFVIMHNGLRVFIGEANGYYGNFSQILCINRGVHEPQEEYAFAQVLKHVDPTLPMMELGAYWGFYSLWYKHHCPEAQVYLVEPELRHLEIGKKNFLLNNTEGHFINNIIGEGGLDIIRFLDQNKIPRLSILHADIQGAEDHLLASIESALAAKRIDFLMISTHSQELHYGTISTLEGHGYRIVAAADFENDTFSYDGIVVACAPDKTLQPFNLYSRSKDSLETCCEIRTER